MKRKGRKITRKPTFMPIGLWEATAQDVDEANKKDYEIYLKELKEWENGTLYEEYKEPWQIAHD